ncbi:MAG: hypothetical protein PHO48_04115 [Candidatus Gracilibacteria bacterium]|nr:hypothetical protein [Candidatus Gracilibacteria bacterium]
MKNFLRYFTACCVLLLNLATASAIGIKPLRVELTIDPGNSATATLRVINSEATALQLKPEVVIYTKNDEKGFPVAEELAADNPANIRSWFTFEDSQIDLPANSEKEVNFTVTVPKDAAAGGRYASVMYIAAGESENKGNLQVNTAVPSLILLTVTGNQIQTGSFENFALRDTVLAGDIPLAFNLAFKNTGNIHAKPSGSVAIFDQQTGKQLTSIARYNNPATGESVVADTIPINLNGGNVLPGSPRIFEVAWNENIISGKFTAKASLGYAKDKSPLLKSVSFEIAEDLQTSNFQFIQTDNSAYFQITATNNGNVNEKLTGKVKVTNEFETVVAAPKIPEDSAYIKPGETVTIQIPWLSKALPAGSYTAELLAEYGFAKTPVTAKTTFSSSGDNLFIYAGIGGGVVIILAGGFFAYRLGRRKK